jgi:hypothetical protein
MPAAAVYELQIYDLTDDGTIFGWLLGFALTPLTGGGPLVEPRQE